MVGLGRVGLDGRPWVGAAVILSGAKDPRSAPREILRSAQDDNCA